MKEMLTQFPHRGPNGEEIYNVSNQGLFGHRQLAIIDLEQGAQPMFSEDGPDKFFFNSEIYYYIELKEQLNKKGLVLNSTSDSEVLLQLLIHKVTEVFPDFNGIFTFVFREELGAQNLYFSKR